MEEKINDMLYEKLKKKLKICKKVSGNREINIRCPICKDSKTDPFKARMYIQNKPPFKFKCFNCEASGIVDEKFLSKLEIDDFSLNDYIRKENKRFTKKMNYKYGNTVDILKKKNIIFPDIKKEHLFKKEYIENRLGILIPKEDTSKYKIIYSINDFIKENKLEKIINENNKGKIYGIDQNSIGFLSFDRSHIIFRNILNVEKYGRYANFSLFPELDGKKTYMIKNDIDLSKRVYNLILTEGIIDIIGVYNHIYNKQDEGNIFIANCGKSFTLTSDIMKKLSILNAEINIYSDQDVPISFYRNLMSYEVFYRLNGINLYYNNIGKDYGVKKEEISLKDKIVL